MKKSKDVFFDFWQVVASSHKHGFARALWSISQMKPVGTRNAEVNGYHVRFEDLGVDKTQRYFFGDFVKLRMDILPRKGGLTSESTSLNLPKTEGISEPFAFLFDTQSGILVTQKNHYAGSVRALADYVEIVGKKDLGGTVQINPVWSVAGLQRLNAMTAVTKFSYRIARPSNPSLDPKSGGSVDGTISEMDNFGAAEVELVVSASRSKKPLTLRQVVARAKELLSGDSSEKVELKKFDVSGFTNSGRDEFDLVKEQLRAKISMAIGTSRELSFAARAKAAEQALALRRDELVEQFGKQCE